MAKWRGVQGFNIKNLEEKVNELEAEKKAQLEKQAAALKDQAQLEKKVAELKNKHKKTLVEEQINPTIGKFFTTKDKIKIAGYSVLSVIALVGCYVLYQKRKKKKRYNRKKPRGLRKKMNGTTDNDSTIHIVKRR